MQIPVCFVFPGEGVRGLVLLTHPGSAPGSIGRIRRRGGCHIGLWLEGSTRHGVVPAS